MKSIWVSSSINKEKPWGNETVWATGGNSRIQGKMLHLNKGCRNSLKYNGIKDETLFIVAGCVQLTFSDENFKRHKTWQTQVVKVGQTINIQSGCPYRIKAIQDSTIVEIGTRASGDIPVRFHDDYGRHSDAAEYKVYEQAETIEKSMLKIKDI